MARRRDRITGDRHARVAALAFRDPLYSNWRSNDLHTTFERCREPGESMEEMKLGLVITSEHGAEVVDDATRRLLRELRDVDDIRVRLVQRPADLEGGKAVDILALGHLAVDVLSTSAITALVAALRDWIRARQVSVDVVKPNGERLTLKAGDAEAATRVIRQLQADDPVQPGH